MSAVRLRRRRVVRRQTGELIDPRIIADQRPQHVDDRCDVECARGVHRRDVDPVLRSIEQRLEDDEILSGQERQSTRTERVHLGTIGSGIVELGRTEEQINGGSTPPEANLLVLEHSPDVDVMP
jgi:hypothetical protein